MLTQLKKINDAFSAFPDKDIIPLASDGDWSMHHLLEYLLEKYGPAEVWVSSFSITEVAIRTFLNLQEKGLIQQLHCLFDFTVKRHKTGLLFFASHIVSEIAIDKCHAKLILIRSEKVTITVVASANFNINDKKEVAIIHFSQWFFEFYLNKLIQWMESGIKISANEFN